MKTKFIINFFIWFLKYAPRLFKVNKFALLVMLAASNGISNAQMGVMRLEIGRLRVLLKDHGIEPDIQGGMIVTPNWKKP